MDTENIPICIPVWAKVWYQCDWQDNQNDQTWIEKALQLQTELRELGVKKAHEKIISIFREYNIYMPDSTQRPTNIDDILVIINDKNWYTTQQDTKQTLIYMISYGIFDKATIIGQ